MKTIYLPIFYTLFLITSCSTLKTRPNIVHLVETPMSGVAPQVLIDSNNRIHLSIFVKNTSLKKSNTGNLFYLTKIWNEKKWSNPIRINSIKNNITYRSIIAHHQMAITKKGKPHITWFQEASGKYFYSYQSIFGAPFSKEINMVTQNIKGHEAGASLAINHKNQIFFVFSAGDFSREDQRQIFFKTSLNEGRSFGPEQELSMRKYGSCACCSISANISTNQELSVLYRSAQELKSRDMRLAQTNTNQRVDRLIEPWKVNACPVSTHYLSNNNSLVIENEGHIYFKRSNGFPLKRITPSNEVRNKNPSLATNANEKRLVLWSKGNGWSSGGELYYSLLEDKKIINTKIKIKKYSRANAIALPSGDFIIYY